MSSTSGEVRELAEDLEIVRDLGHAPLALGALVRNDDAHTGRSLAREVAGM